MTAAGAAVGLASLGADGPRSEDLAPLMAAEPEPQAVRFAKGRVVEWDPVTGHNVIELRGTRLVDLQLMMATSGEALAIAPGDWVGLHIIGAGAAATVYVVGRITRPGADAAEVIRRVLSSNTYSASVVPHEVLGPSNPAVFTDLATPGPTLSNIPIHNGRCLVTVSSQLGHGGNTAFCHAAMGFEISGATSQAPTLDLSLEVMVVEQGFLIGASRTFLVEDLAPGLHTFQAKYANGSTANNSSFENRTITVMAF